jgi:hypothetical protein
MNFSSVLQAIEDIQAVLRHITFSCYFIQVMDMSLNLTYDNRHRKCHVEF